MPAGITPAGITPIESLQIDGPAAGRRATTTGHLFDVLAEVIVHSQFLATPNRTPRVIQDVAFADLCHDIGIAAVIDIFGAAAPHCPIEGPVVVQGEKINHLVLLLAAPFGFLAADLLARVFDDLAAGGNVFSRIDSPAMNFRWADIELETSMPGID